METILHPQHIEDSEQLEDVMSAPMPEVVEATGGNDGRPAHTRRGWKDGPDAGKTGKTCH